MPLPCLLFESVGFEYDSSTEALVRNISIQFTSGWYGIIGPNGSGKTTLLRLACRELVPTTGTVTGSHNVVLCPQRTDEPPELWETFLKASDSRAFQLRGKLEIEGSWSSRWLTLSHGERKRAQIATALWQEPEVLAIDEPTNHIDAAARSMLLAALSVYRGIGMLVSHDRELLDALCVQTLFMEPPRALLRPGGYSKAIELHEAEYRAARTAEQTAEHELERIRAEAARRQHEAQQADRKRSLRHVSPRDSDARARMNAVRVSGKDGKAGRLAAQFDGRLRQAQARVDAIHVAKRFRLGIELAGEPSPRTWLLRLDEGELSLGESRILYFERLALGREDRVAIVGPNGAGKSTFVRHILASLTLPDDRVVYIPQEIGRDHAVQILNEVRRLPHDRLGNVMTIINCLGSRPERLLQSNEPSPGELRKILLALGMARLPNLIVMDEPTNHLDLPSIECMEHALVQVRCALVLVSHDRAFLDRVTKTTWRLERIDNGKNSRLSREF